MQPQITLQSLSASEQSNVPFTFGQVFAPGDMEAGRGLVARGSDGISMPLQVDQKATHPDGSVRHAILSGTVPTMRAATIGENGELQYAMLSLKLLDADKVLGLAAMGNVLASVEIFLAGVDYVAKLDSSASGADWLVGPIVNERQFAVPFVAADGSKQPDLMAYFSVRDYGVNQRVDVVIEHTNAFSLTGDLTYDAKVYSGSALVYQQDALTHYANTRWRKVFWTGVAPSIHVRHDTAYLIASGAIPNYDQSVLISDDSLADYAGTPPTLPMGRSRFVADMGTTGGRPDIGLMPDVYVAAILSQDSRAFDAMIKMAEAGASWGTHRRDTATGRPLNIVDHPKTSSLGRESDAWNSVTDKSEWLGRQPTSNPLNADSAHQPAFSYLPYLLTGDYFHLEELHFWANYSLYQSNPTYRKDSAGLVNWDQLRGQGWTMRTLGEAAATTPDDHPDKAKFVGWLDNNLSYYVATYVDGNANNIGVVTDGYTFSYANGTALAPWQCDHFMSAIGHVSELGFDKSARLAKWLAKFQIGRMVDPGYCSMDAAIYNLKLKDTWDGPIYSTLSEVYQNSVDPAMYALKCSSAGQLVWRNVRRASDEPVPYVAGEIIGYARSTEGFPSNFQPALAMAVDTGYPGGADGWAKFASRPTQPNYGTGAQFAIIPRKIASTPPPEGNTMTFTATIELTTGEIQLPAGSQTAPTKTVVDILLAGAVVASKEAAPYSFPGLNEGEYTYKVTDVDSNGVTMGTPVTGAFTAKDDSPVTATVTTGATVTVTKD